MVPVEWPVAAADDGEAAPPARIAGRGRLPTVRIDFFLDRRARLTEQERALMAGMLADLVGTLADELRVELASSEPANDDGDQLLDTLRSSGMLDIPDLLRLLLRRAEEERVSAALRAGQGPARPRFLQSLVSDQQLEVSATAMALILARGRRRDRFDGPRLVFDDLSAEAAVALVNAIAACFRRDLAKRFGTASADDRLAAAAQVLLSRHDEGNRLEARLFELAHSLDAAGRLDDRLILSALEEGEAALLAEMLGRRAGIGFDDAWEYFTGPDGNLALVLRMSGVSRAVAGEIVASLAEVIGSDAETEISAFDSLADEDVEKSRKWLRLDGSYRSAIESLAESNGKRAV
jgi:hypothetical protein